MASIVTIVDMRLTSPVMGEAVEHPCYVGAALAAQSHVGVIVTQDPVLKVIIFKLGHILYCVILNRKNI